MLDGVLITLKNHRMPPVFGRWFLTELVNDDIIILLSKRTGKGTDTHISLNPRHVADMRAFLD